MPSKRRHPIPAGYRAIAGSERRPSPSARVVGAADPNEVFRVTLVLRRRPDGEKPADYDDDFLQTPPADRQRMSRDDFVAKYGAADDDLRKVTDFLTDRGLEVIELHPDRRQVIAEGTVATFAEAFAVKLERYEHTVKLSLRGEPTTETYRGRDGEVYVPESLHGIVLGVFGLDNRRVGKTNGNPEPPNTTTVSVPTVSKLYDYPTNSASGQTIGIFSLSGYDSTDITTYFTNLGAGFTAPTVTDILINGATNPGSDPFGETTQDIEIAAAFAPGSAVNVYITTGDQAGWVQALGRVAHPDPGDSAPSVLSSSWFISDGDDTAGMADQGVSSAFITAVTVAFQDAAIQGVTVCIASGDRGTDSNVGDGNAHVQYPGSDPWVLCVGGTTVGNIIGTSFDEYVWNDPQTGNWGTTGGGVSARFPIPSYQSSLSLPSAVNTPTYTGRCVPDVAGNANINSGYSGIILAGAATVGNGTSASAPQWAGLIAVLNAALGVNLGFINPALYALGSAYFRDIVPGAGPADNSNSGVTGYQAGAGWDACTGWGSPKGNLLLSGLRSIFTRSLYFVVDKSTFGHDEVADIITTSGGFYSSAFWLVLEGVSIHQLGTLTPTLGGAFDSLQVQGVTIFPDPSGPSFEDPSDLYTPQRIRFAYNLIFTSTSIAPMATVFPGAGLSNFDVLTASITAPGGATPLQAEAVFELVSGADPYFTNVDPQTHQAFYLSQDIRVFSGVEGDAPVPGGPALTSDGYGSIQAILAYVNGNASWTTPAPGDPLNSLPSQGGYETADSSVTPLVGGQPNFSFAIVRVRLQGAAGDTAANVRVFFRLWVAQSFDTDFQPTTTYLSTTGTGVEAGLPVAPLPSGSSITDPQGNSVQTVPFFATGASGPHDYDGTNANANIRSIVVPGGQDKTWAYFGCFLDVYNTAHQSIFAGDHHCIVAQIAYDDAPIVNSNGVTQSPENSDKLAQRNLQITSSGNPGWPDTHRIPQAFDARRSPTAVATGQMQDWPDELMIDWGAVPVGSTAQLYWPEAAAADVIALAQKLYGKTRLKALDAHTLGIATTRGVSFVPIPFGATGENLAGLFSVDLPNTIAVGQIFDIRVRRVVSRRMGKQQPPTTGPTINSTLSTKGGGGRGLSRNWRYVTGTFQVQIPVGDERQLLVPEKNKLAVLKWRLERYPAQYRWRPVMERYIEYVSGRVDGFGGDASDVPPSILGWPGKRHPGGGTEGGPGGGLGDGRRGCVGKVAAILFDAFGDFKGFELVTELGARHAYGGCEPEVESLVREAWSRRILIEVVAIEHAPHRTLAIVFLREPRQIHA
jgi:hypothetical protein